MNVLKVERISSCAHEYDGKKISVDEKFNVEPGHIGLLLMLGRIRPEEGEPGYEPAESEIDQPVAAKARRNGRSRSL